MRNLHRDEHFKEQVLFIQVLGIRCLENQFVTGILMMAQISEQGKLFCYYFVIRQQRSQLSSCSIQSCRFEPSQFRMVLEFLSLLKLGSF